MEFKFAKTEDIEKVTYFFKEHIKSDNDAINSREFLCPIGLKIAIKNNNVIICIKNDIIIGGLRFYIRKKDNIVSLYQFAIIKDYRGKNILNQMLRKTNCYIFESICHRNSNFNQYYKKTGWILKKQNVNLNTWTITI